MQFRKQNQYILILANKNHFQKLGFENKNIFRNHANILAMHFKKQNHAEIMVCKQEHFRPKKTFSAQKNE